MCLAFFIESHGFDSQPGATQEGSPGRKCPGGELLKCYLKASNPVAMGTGRVEIEGQFPVDCAVCADSRPYAVSRDPASVRASDIPGWDKFCDAVDEALAPAAKSKTLVRNVARACAGLMVVAAALVFTSWTVDIGFSDFPIFFVVLVLIVVSQNRRRLLPQGGAERRGWGGQGSVRAVQRRRRRARDRAHAPELLRRKSGLPQLGRAEGGEATAGSRACWTSRRLRPPRREGRQPRRSRRC